MYNDEMFLRISEIYKVLADPNRLKILFYLREGEKSVKELIEILNIKQANISKHLSVLRNANIVRARRDKNNVYYSFTDLPLNTMCDIICDYMKERLKKEERALGIK